MCSVTGAWVGRGFDGKQLPCERVTHEPKVFTKNIERYEKKTTSLAGTQLLDRTYLSLKTVLPHHLVAKQKKDENSMNERISEYVHVCIPTTAPQRLTAHCLKELGEAVAVEHNVHFLWRNTYFDTFQICPQSG